MLQMHSGQYAQGEKDEHLGKGASSKEGRNHLRPYRDMLDGTPDCSLGVTAQQFAHVMADDCLQCIYTLKCQ